MSNRAYLQMNGQWKHIHIVERFVQTDIFGSEVERVALGNSHGPQGRGLTK